MIEDPKNRFFEKPNTAQKKRRLILLKNRVFLIKIMQELEGYSLEALKNFEKLKNPKIIGGQKFVS